MVHNGTASWRENAYRLNMWISSKIISIVFLYYLLYICTEFVYCQLFANIYSLCLTAFFFLIHFCSIISFILCRWFMNPNQHFADILLWIMSKYHNHLFRHSLCVCMCVFFLIICLFVTSNNGRNLLPAIVSTYQTLFHCIRTFKDMQAYTKSSMHVIGTRARIFITNIGRTIL